MTGNFNSLATSVTAFSATRSETLKWPIAMRRWRALVSTSMRVIMMSSFKQRRKSDGWRTALSLSQRRHGRTLTSKRGAT